MYLYEISPMEKDEKYAKQQLLLSSSNFVCTDLENKNLFVCEHLIREDLKIYLVCVEISPMKER